MLTAMEQSRASTEKKGGGAMLTTERREYIQPAMPADWVSGPPQGQWTYREYAALPDDGNRYEVVCGVFIYGTP